jgi:hypothetical protein
MLQCTRQYTVIDDIGILSKYFSKNLANGPHLIQTGHPTGL